MSIAQFVAEAWRSVGIDQYALRNRKALKSSDLQGSLFDSEGQPSLPGMSKKSNWDEQAHPRAPKGSTESHGGQFVKKDSAPAAVGGKESADELRAEKRKHDESNYLKHLSLLQDEALDRTAELLRNSPQSEEVQMKLTAVSDELSKRGGAQKRPKGIRDPLAGLDPTIQEPSEMDRPIDINRVAPWLRDTVIKRPKLWKRYTDADPDGDQHNPTVRFEFEKGYILSPISQDKPARVRAEKRSMGALIGIKPMAVEDVEANEASYFQQEQLSDDHPRKVKFNHRMELKNKLPVKLKPMITFAKRLGQADFIKTYSDSLDGIKDATGLDGKEFWRQVRNGPPKPTAEDGPKNLTADAANYDKRLSEQQAKRDPDGISEQPADTGPIPIRERKAFAEALAKQGKSQSEIVEVMTKRGVALSDAKRLATKATGTSDEGPKDGDVNAEGLVFRNGRWHRDDELKSDAAPKATKPTAPPKEYRPVEEVANEIRKKGMEFEEKLNQARKTNPFATHDESYDKAYREMRDLMHETNANPILFEEERDMLRSTFASHWPDIREDEDSDSTEPNPKVDREVGESMDPPKLIAESKPETPTEKASAALEAAQNAGKTPRESSAAAQKQLDEDYEFARKSDVRNAGEDLKGSARHKVNAWRGLAQAEKDGTAQEFMTRKGLLKIEPHNLMATISDTHAMAHLVAHSAISAFPESPGAYPSHYEKYRDRMGNPLPPRKSDEELRKQYHAAYLAIKTKAEELATTEVDPRVVSREIAAEVKRQINIARGLSPNASGMGTLDAKDPYNPVANGLVNLANRAAGSGRKKTDFMNRILEVSKLSREKYGDTPSKEHLSNIKQHVLDLMEGKSLNKTFGKESKAVRRFDPSEAYVKHASRKGGRDLSKVTADPNKATKHMVETMGLRGVQWGNSVTDDERKHHAAKAVEALTDLADVTGLHPKDIALDGKLGLAIGARGRGNASAHYEPGTQVVNLTRASGVGALAHEWGHAFDHMLEDFSDSRTSGNYMSRNFGSKSNDDGKREIREAYAKWWNDSSVKYRVRLSDYLRSEVRNGGMSAKKANEYWNSGHEIFARSFERHVQHKLESEGKQNTYLAGLGGEYPLWPTSEEAAGMSEAFEGILSAYRKYKHGSAEKVKFSRREAHDAFASIARGSYRPVLLSSL